MMLTRKTARKELRVQMKTHPKGFSLSSAPQRIVNKI
jgi:hypothetical protein